MNGINNGRIWLALLTTILHACSPKIAGVSKVNNLPVPIPSKGIVVFLDSKCEDSKKMISVLNYINEMSDSNYTYILMINPIHNTLNDMHQFIHDHELTKWKAYLDQNNQIAKGNSVSKTPFVFIVNDSYKVLYQGALINSKEPENIETSPLIKAIKSLSVKETKLANTAVNDGCKIE